MKKILLSLALLFIVVGSIYTVYDYNKAGYDATNNKSTDGNSSEKNKLSLNQYNTNEPLNKEVKEVSAKVKATDFKLKDLEGKEVSLSDFKGKNVFINFWATWCPPCKAEMPYLQQLYEETKDSDLVILAINLNEDKTTVEKFMIANNYSFPVLLDTDFQVGGAYQAVSIPTSYFINKEGDIATFTDSSGNIVNKHVGAMTLEQMKYYVNNIK